MSDAEKTRGMRGKHYYMYGPSQIALGPQGVNHKRMSLDDRDMAKMIEKAEATPYREGN